MFLEELVLLFYIQTCKTEYGRVMKHTDSWPKWGVGVWNFFWCYVNINTWKSGYYTILNYIPDFSRSSFILIFTMELCSSSCNFLFSSPPPPFFWGGGSVICCNITTVLHVTLCFCGGLALSGIMTNRTTSVRCPTHLGFRYLNTEQLCGMCCHMQHIIVHSKSNLIVWERLGIKSEVWFSSFSTH